MPDSSDRNSFGLDVSGHPNGCEGYIWVELPDGGMARCPGCLDERILAALLEFVPARFHLPVDLPPAAAAWVKRESAAEGLFIVGPLGTGKTCTAYASVARWCLAMRTPPKSPDVVFTRATALFDELRPGNDGVRARVDECQTAGLLVIDDVGAEKPSEWTIEKLYEIVDERYARQLPLIVTSNVPPGMPSVPPAPDGTPRGPSALSLHVGDRVESRLAEMCTVVALTGDDRRRAA